MSNNCIFCKIIAGEIPCDKIYEDDKVLAFLDINPINRGHALVIPKKHYLDLLECPDDLAEYLIRVVKKTGKAVLKVVEADAFNVGLNNGAAAGQVVNHVHWHIIPRFKGDGLETWPDGSYESNEEKAQVASKISDELNTA